MGLGSKVNDRHDVWRAVGAQCGHHGQVALPRNSRASLVSLAVDINLHASAGNNRCYAGHGQWAPKTVVTAKTVVIFGGRSEIGLELACRLAAGSTVVLATRGADRLDDEVAAVRSAGAAGVHTVEFNADELDSRGPMVAALVGEFGPIDIAVLAFGILGDQARAETDAAHAVAIVTPITSLRSVC